MISVTRPREDGFTLIEILIVVVILGVVAGIVVFAVGDMSNDAGKKACATEAHAFDTAVQSYRTSPAHLNLLPPGNDLAEVAGTLFHAGLLSSDQVKFGVTGPATANHWGFVVGTGAVTPDAATCTA